MRYILRYLKSIVDYNLLFDSLLENVKSLLRSIDADQGHDLNKNRSTSRYMFTLDDETSTLQKCVVQSRTEAEYVTAT